jgi:hypothetical protein
MVESVFEALKKTLEGREGVVGTLFLTSFTIHTTGIIFTPSPFAVRADACRLKL